MRSSVSLLLLLLSASIPITTLLPAQAIDEAALLAIKATAGGGHGDTLAS